MIKDDGCSYSLKRLACHHHLSIVLNTGSIACVYNNHPRYEMTAFQPQAILSAYEFGMAIVIGSAALPSPLNCIYVSARLVNM
jgi:hypothetical protein